MSQQPETLQQLIALCKRDRLKSVSKETITNILVNYDPPNVTGAQNLPPDIMTMMQTMTHELSELRKSNEKIIVALERIENIESDMQSLKSENGALKAQLAQQGQVLKQQQMFLEKIDAKERGNNLILMGIPEGTFLGADADAEKMQNVLELLDDEGMASEGVITSVKRLGASESGKIRPILATATSKEMRNKIVNVARSKNQGVLADIRVKKDVDPSVRAEWKRLFESKEAEEKKAENAGHRIELDMRKRQVTRDGQVIDSWCNQLF